MYQWVCEFGGVVRAFAEVMQSCLLGKFRMRVFHCVNVRWKKVEKWLHTFFSFLRVGQKMKVAHLCIQRPKKVPQKLSGTRNVLLDSLKDILETLTEVPLRMHIETSNLVSGFSNVYVEHSWCHRTHLTPARNHRCPLRILWWQFGDTLEKHHLWCT